MFSNGINEIQLRKGFYSGVFGVTLLVLPYYGAAFLIPLAIFESFQLVPWKKRISNLIAISYSLSIIPYLSYILLDESLWTLQLQTFLLSLSIYHLGEYLVQSYFHYSEANFSSNFYSAFLIDQSTEYSIAMFAAFIECFLKLILPYPSFYWNYLIGLPIIILGHTLRIGAEINCGTNFSHQIKFSKKKTHKLVVNGFYRYLLFRLCRHPSYFGWFLWSIGTQIMLGNIICAIGFYKANKRFFKERIELEEETLQEFFEGEYEKFQQTTSPFFPFWNNFLD